MSTRRLIAVALVCGLAILIAGGVWLVLASREAADDVVASFLPIGATAQVGGISATVVDVEQVEGSLVLTVEMATGGAAAGDPGKGWAVISTRGLVARAEQAGPVDRGDCAGRDLEAGGSIRCLVRFLPSAEQASSALVAVFGRNGERASWSIVG